MDQSAPPPKAPTRAIVGWILFDPACQPYFTLITTFIFAPYFASAVAPTPADGQALWGFATGAAGLVIALTSPFLGAVADAAGRRKPWIAAFGVMLMAGAAALWFSPPGDESRIPLILVSFAIGTIGVEFATVFNNSMMASLVPPHRLGRLSGTGWAAGYFGGLVSLALMLAFFSTQPATGLTLLGHPPAFGLDATTHEGERIAGPFTALWFAVLVIPLFAFVPDPPKAMKLKAAMARAVTEMRLLVPRLKARPMLARFLLANMVYADGLVALFAFGGIYGAGIFGWGAVELGIFGILITLLGTFGSLLGGVLDDRLGPRTVIIGALTCLLIACIGIVSLDRDALFFGLYPTAPATGLFASTPQKAYLGLGLLIGLVAGPLQAASRTMLVHLAPAENLSECFGLFALSGKITSFAAPTTVGVVTALTGTQKAAVIVIIVFMSVGMALIWRVRAPLVAEAASALG